MKIAVALLATTTAVSMAQPSVSAPQVSSAGFTDPILIDQVGYLPNSSKVALIREDAGSFDVVDVKSGKTVFTAKTGAPQFWKSAGDTVRTADFTKVTKPGKYKICLKGKSICSFDFDIREGVYNDAAKAAIKAFYLTRCSYAISKEFGGKWARPAGHPDTAVLVHESAASKERPAGTVISCPGGWYDAGDYNKYIVNSGISTYTLLLFYQMFPEYCKQLNTNIPESKNDIPDVVDELLFNLKWMLTMQDPNDGGVYHKCTNKSFDGFEMPDKAKDPRYVVMKCTSAALDFTGVMAMASRLFANSHNATLESLAVTCKNAAVKAYAWAKANPDVIYKQPKDIHTGGYGDNHLEDEWFWANAEMALLNQDKSLVDVKALQSGRLSVPGWPQVDMLGTFSLALSSNPQFKDIKEMAAKRIVVFADSLAAVTKASPYQISINQFNWGSNSDIVNRDLVQLVAMRLSGDKKYMPTIQSDLDYILGKNATGYCFVTGLGSRPVMKIHHRICASDGVVDPIPGLMSGGPNATAHFDCGADKYFSKIPAKSFLDAECSYASNEIAINWNAPLFFVLGSMDALSQKK